MKNKEPIIINNISDLSKLMGYAESRHPLIDIIEFVPGKNRGTPDGRPVVFNLYCIAIKKNITGTVRYGYRQYDFNKGLMTFSAPGQIYSFEEQPDISGMTGWFLVFHPDFIRKYPLSKAISKYGFFSYQTNEALHISEEEEIMIDGIFGNINKEYQRPIDKHSQGIIVSQIDVLLNYADRFYNRQFITRQIVESDTLTRFENILTEYFNSESNTFPAVNDMASQLNISVHYLNDMLRTLTGRTTQQHIHDCLIEKAKVLLSTTELTINEIAYSLGFEYPQYFTRLFKNKTGISPIAFRNNN